MSTHSFRIRLAAGSLVLALLHAGVLLQAGAEAVAPAPGDGVAPIEVLLLADGSQQKLTVARARVAKTEVADESGPRLSQTIAQTIISMVPVLGSFAGMAQMFQEMKGNEVRFIFAIAGTQSPTVVRGSSPAFEIDYGAVAGMSLDSAQPVFVRLTPYKTYYRVTGITVTYDRVAGKAAMSGKPVEAGTPNHEVRINARVRALAPGRAAISPERPLDPGEYGITFRAANGALDPSLAFSYWDFSVAGAEADPAGATGAAAPALAPPTIAPPTVAPST